MDVQRLHSMADQLQRERVQGDDSKLANAFKDLLKKTSELQNGAAQSAEQYLATGEGELHEVMIEVAKADVTFRFLLEVRNKLTEAYQEINRMPV